MSSSPASPNREELYLNLSLLESVAEYGRRSAGEIAAPNHIPDLSAVATAFLSDWQGHAAVRLWLRLAQPTLDALQTFVNLDLAPSTRTQPDGENNELKDALEASRIAIRTLQQRLEFQAQRWTPHPAAS